MSEETEPLSVALEAAALRAIRATYGDLNATFFKGRLRRPTLELGPATARLGRWIREERRLELSRVLLVRHGWGVLVEVLKHEMAHQFTDEVLGATDEPAHGPTFRKTCEERGIDARAAGRPEATEELARAPVLDRIAKLLALAESPNEHEAQAAMNAAQRLMLKHNLEELTRGPGHACSYRHLGRPTGRVSEAERVLANILAEHFFVDAIWVPVWRAAEGKRGSVLEILRAPREPRDGRVRTFISSSHCGTPLGRAPQGSQDQGESRSPGLSRGRGVGVSRSARGAGSREHAGGIGVGRRSGRRALLSRPPSAHSLDAPRVESRHARA